MEVASPAGIPVAPLPQPADGHITIPPNDIEMVDLYNPATLSYDAMWYAVNPSYDWLFCMAKYCAFAGIITFCVAPLTTKNSPQKAGSQTCTQISFVSSYSAIRIWRIFYKTSSCIIRYSDNEHVGHFASS